MRNKLIILLHANDLTNPSWMTETYTHRGDVNSLAAVAAHRDVIVIVPAEDVLLLGAILPTMSRARLRQALPFALEDQLTADVEELHFALADRQPDGNVPAAVVARAKMQEWLDLLASWQVTPDVMIPLTLALPIGHAVISDVAVFRSSELTGFASDKHNFAELLALAAFSPADIQENITEPLNVVNILTTGMPALNLLQGEYAVRRSKLPYLQGSVKVMTWLAMAWVVLLFLYPTVSWMVLARRENAIDVQIATIYRRHFHDATSVVAPKLRLQEKWQALTSAGDNKALLLVGYVGKALQQVANVKIKHIDFQQNQLTLQLVANTTDDFANYVNYLMQQGLKIKQQNVNFSGGRLSGILQVE